MGTNNWQNFSFRIVLKGGRRYMTTIFFYYGPPTSGLTPTSNAQKEVFRDLLYEMTRTPPPESYRGCATTNPTYTIVEKKEGKHNYRIDNQMRLELSDPDSRLNIQYQINRNSHAMVLVKMKPIMCPPGITVGLVDEDKTFGFRPATVMGFIEKALKHSADDKCCTYIAWKIEEIESGSNIKPVDMMHGLEMAATKLRAKVGSKAAAKVGAKVLVAQSSMRALKKVPLMGLFLSAAYSVQRFISGDQVGALLEVASGAASCIPGYGTAASIGIDAVLLVRDMEAAGLEAMDPEKMDLEALNLEELKD